MTDRSLSILLVEDNLGDATLMSILLEESSCKIELHHVHNGEEALSYIQERKGSDRPDLILLDLKMPRMDGLDFLRERRTDPDLTSIPTIILTGSDAESDRDKALELGADMYVMKPANIDEADSLVPTIEMFIRRRNTQLCSMRHDRGLQ